MNLWDLTPDIIQCKPFTISLKKKFYIEKLNLYYFIITKTKKNAT